MKNFHVRMAIHALPKALLILSIAVFFFGAPIEKIHAQPESGPVVYVYHPDANLRNMAELKSLLREYLRNIDTKVMVEAFLQRQDFERALLQRPPDFVLVSSWVGDQVMIQNNFRPLLRGQVRSGRTYEKVLISKKPLPSGGSVTLSMVGLGYKDINSVKGLLPELRGIPSIHMVEVSKDVDAVLAVSFDLVDLALVRPENIDAIRLANQEAVKDLRVLATSKPIPFPVFLASPQTVSFLIERFVRGLTALQDPKSQSVLNMMGFQSWGVQK